MDLLVSSMHAYMIAHTKMEYVTLVLQLLFLCFVLVRLLSDFAHFLWISFPYVDLH